MFMGLMKNVHSPIHYSLCYCPSLARASTGIKGHPAQDSPQSKHDPEPVKPTAGTEDVNSL